MKRICISCCVRCSNKQVTYGLLSSAAFVWHPFPLFLPFDYPFSIPCLSDLKKCYFWVWVLGSSFKVSHLSLTFFESSIERCHTYTENSWDCSTWCSQLSDPTDPVLLSSAFTLFPPHAFLHHQQSNKLSVFGFLHHKLYCRIVLKQVNASNSIQANIFAVKCTVN